MRNITLMKRIFMLLAVVLLTSASAMAQSGNNSPLKGDVNSDGSVDVADIVAVIDLIQKGQEVGEAAGYFYLGTTKPTAENFTTLTGAVATYTSIDEAVGTKVSVAAGETLYMLCPTSWMKAKDVGLEDEGGETVNFSNDVDATTIPGYSIYEIQAWKSSTVTLKASPLYWFGIAINPSDNYINPNNYTAMQGVINPVSNIVEGEHQVTITTANYLYIVIPAGYDIVVMNGIFEVNMFTHNGVKFVRNTDATIDNGTYKIYRSATLCYDDVSITITKNSQ